MINKRVIFFSLLASLVLFLLFKIPGCWKKGLESEILDVINRIAECAEKRDISCIMTSISPEYSDKEGRNRNDIEELLKSYSGRFSGISVNILGTRIAHESGTVVDAVVDISVSSGMGRFFRKILRFYGKILRLNISFSKDSEKWKITGAIWEEISVNELLPGSLKMLRKLFPSVF